MGVLDNSSGTAEEYIAHLQSQIHGLQGEVRTLKEEVQRRRSCSDPAHLPAPPPPLPPISSLWYELPSEPMNLRATPRNPVPSKRLHRQQSRPQSLLQASHPQLLPRPLSRKPSPRRPSPQPSLSTEQSPQQPSSRQPLPSPTPPTDTRIPPHEQPSSSNLEVFLWKEGDHSTTMVPKSSSAPRTPKRLINNIPSSQAQLDQQRKALGFDSCEGIYRAVADILFLRAQSDAGHQCNDLWAGNTAEYLNLRTLQILEAIGNSHRIAKLSSYGALVFIGECIVAMSLGAKEASVDKSMQTFLTLKRGAECRASPKTLQSYRRVPITITRETDALYQSIGNNSFEVFLHGNIRPPFFPHSDSIVYANSFLGGGSLATLELLSRSATCEAFRSASASLSRLWNHQRLMNHHQSFSDFTFRSSSGPVY